MLEVPVEFGFTPGDLAANFTYLAFELTQAGFLSIFADRFRQCFSVEFYIVFRKPVFLNLFGYKVTFCDLELFFFGITRQPDRLHPIPQRWLHGIEHIRRRHKHHVGKIECNAQVVIAKRRVLLRIKHLEQSARRVAAKIGPDHVNLIEHYQRIVGSRLLYRLDYPARHGPDICPAMAANFGFVVQTA